MENPVKLSCAHKLLTQPESVEGNNKTPENKPVSGFGNDSDSEHKTCVQSDSQTYGGLLSVTSGLTEAHSLQPSSHQSRCFSMASGNGKSGFLSRTAFVFLRFRIFHIVFLYRVAFKCWLLGFQSTAPLFGPRSD